MIEQDTIKLLRECDAGIKMGVASIDDVLPHVHSRELKNILTECKRRHETLKSELQQRLDRFGDEGKNPNPIAKGMSWMKTNMKLNMEESDATIADLMTDGCNMGVKSLSRYLNQYKAAEEYSKDIAKKLIHLEAQLATDIRGYL
jgi:DNA gyrase/topoisomerase IV subunit A